MTPLTYKFDNENAFKFLSVLVHIYIMRERPGELINAVKSALFLL